MRRSTWRWPMSSRPEKTGVQPLGIAILGCGRIARLHSLILRFQPGVRRYFASRDPARARAFDRRFRGSGWFNSYRAACDDDRIDAVLVTTPPHQHRELALEALGAGKHVIVEKPAFLTVGEYDEVMDASADAGRRVFVAENYFYKPLVRKLREVVTSGRLGEVRFVLLHADKRRGSGDWRGDPALAGGGALFEGGVHWVHFLAHLGLRVRSIRGFRAGDPAVPERSTAVVVEYTGSAVGILVHSWETPAPFGGLRFSRIQGTAGSAVFESNGLFLAVSGQRPWVSVPGPLDLLGYRGMHRDFLASIRSGRPPRWTLGEAREDHLLVMAALAGSKMEGDAVPDPGVPGSGTYVQDRSGFIQKGVELGVRMLP